MKSTAETAQAAIQKFGDRAGWVARYRSKHYPTTQGRAHWAAVLKILTKAPAQKSRRGWTADPNVSQWYTSSGLVVYQVTDGFEWWNLKTNDHETEPTLARAQRAAERSKP